MTDWRSIDAVTRSERDRLIQLATYGALRIRARRVFGQDYEPHALAAAERELEEARKAQEREAQRKAQDGGSYVQPLGFPAVRGEKPWLAKVPLKTGVEEMAELPAALAAQLDDSAWATGRFELIDQEDFRRRWLMEGIEVAENLTRSESLERVEGRETRDPHQPTRENFYSPLGRAQWPIDCGQHIFLGRAVDALGDAMFPSRWRQSDPTAPIEDPLHMLSIRSSEFRHPRPENFPYLILADELLRERHPHGLRAMSPPLSRSIADDAAADLRSHRSIQFSDAEWAEAAVIAGEMANEDVLGLYRYDCVVRELAQAAAAGALQTGAQHPRGGKVAELGEDLWYSSDLACRFDTCRINLEDPFSEDAPSDRDCFLFVDSASLAQLLQQRDRKDAPRGPGRPRGAGYQRADVASFERMRELISGGAPVATAAKQVERELDPKASGHHWERLRKAYPQWLKSLGEK